MYIHIVFASCYNWAQSHHIIWYHLYKSLTCCQVSNSRGASRLASPGLLRSARPSWNQAPHVSNGLRWNTAYNCREKPAAFWGMCTVDMQVIPYVLICLDVCWSFSSGNSFELGTSKSFILTSSCSSWGPFIFKKSSSPSGSSIKKNSGCPMNQRNNSFISNYRLSSIAVHLSSTWEMAIVLPTWCSQPVENTTLKPATTCSDDTNLENNCSLTNIAWSFLASWTQHVLIVSPANLFHLFSVVSHGT